MDLGRCELRMATADQGTTKVEQRRKNSQSVIDHLLNCNVFCFASVKSSEIDRIIILFQHDHLHQPHLARSALLRERTTEIRFVGRSLFVDGDYFLVVRLWCIDGRRLLHRNCRNRRGELVEFFRSGGKRTAVHFRRFLLRCKV